MMTEHYVEQEASRSTSCKRRLYSLVVAFAYICITASVILFVAVIIGLSRTKNCAGCRSNSTGSTATIATVFFVVGVTLALLVRLKRGSNSSTPQVVISPIPAEDLEKSPAPILPYNHIPQRQQFLNSVKHSSIDLPDYFTAVENIEEVYLSVEAAVWTDDIPETPPPCYEQALKMASITSEGDTHSSLKHGNADGTRL